jgi:AcrR family transcriptional regulator
MLFVMSTGPGLRERKKRETRQRISDEATRLFLARGFDQVTVVEVAAAAGVSPMTVFNYFPRKEDLLFDRDEEAAALLTTAIRDRPVGCSVSAALRALLLGLIATRHPLSGVREGIEPFYRLVHGSPALLAAAREGDERIERHLATVIAETVHPSGDPYSGEDNDPLPTDLVAGLLWTVFHTARQRAVAGIVAGRSADDVAPAIIALVNRAFDMLDTSLGDYGRRTDPDQRPKD